MSLLFVTFQRKTINLKGAGYSPKHQNNSTERTEHLDGGGSLLIRGYECSECKGFTRKKTGVKDFCALCGSKNTLKILEEVKN